MSKNKIYLPADKKINLFSISSTKNGIVIPLEPFGYGFLHLTIYIKSMANKEGYRKFSIHLTDDRTNEIVKEVFAQFNEEQTTQQLSQKFSMLQTHLHSTLRKHIVPVVLGRKKLVCHDCLIDHHMKSESLNTRAKAEIAYWKLITAFNNSETPELSPCQQQKHRTLIDLNSAKIYMKGPTGPLKYANMKSMYKDLDSVFERIFADELKWIDMAKKDLFAVLKRYKLK